MATITRLKSLAGVRIPDTPLTKAAVDLLEVTSPQFICNHCIRTYVFGNLAVRSIGRSIIDEEIAFWGPFCTTLGSFPPMTAKIALKWTVPTLLENFVWRIKWHPSGLTEYGRRSPCIHRQA